MFLKFVAILLIILVPTFSMAGQVTLSWDPVTTNVDGTPCTDLAGYKIYWGTYSHYYGKLINVGNLTTYTIIGIDSDKQILYFVVTAYDTEGNESSFSNEVNTEVIVPPSPPPFVCTSGPYVFYLGGIQGWITYEPVCSGGYAVGQVIQLTGMPYDATITKFSHWSGDISGTENPINYTFSGAKTTLSFTANFILKDQTPGIPNPAQNLKITIELP